MYCSRLSVLQAMLNKDKIEKFDMQANKIIKTYQTIYKHIFNVEIQCPKNSEISIKMANFKEVEDKIKKADDAYIEESICKLCGLIVQKEITKIKLDTTILYFGSYSDDNSFVLFVKEYNLLNRKYLIYLHLL